MLYKAWARLVKLNKRNVITINTNAPLPSQQTLGQLLVSVPCWAKYRGSAYASGVLPDESGNGRNAACTDCTLSNTTGFGGGPTPKSICRGVSTIKGSSTILFPVGSIPQSPYTIAFIARYSGGSTNRISTGHLGQNFILDHHSAKLGLWFDGTQWVTPILNAKPINNTTTNLSDWLSMCVVSSGTAPPNNVIVNGVPKGALCITPNSNINQLAINTSSFIEKSSFEFAHLIIWDAALTSVQMKAVTDSFANYIIDGNLI